MPPSDPLDLFLPPVARWFRAALGEPTPAQRDGWPAIASGSHTLILAPTGSGKTLAAFLACLDRLWRQEAPDRGVRVLYVSPLKALNQDIHRNLQAPLEGVAEQARQMGYRLPAVEAAVRTGDTPPAERQRMLRRPPHVLITTPESLHLLLTSRAREVLRGVTHCIVDEIHALCANKRGVFLALLLERLAALTGRDFVRIGLSATQRPLDEVARYLGGLEQAPEGRFAARPVAVVDAGLRKDLDLRVVSPVGQFGPLPERSVWPSVYRLLLDEVRRHRSTIIFANNRRTVERITANLNELDAQGGGAGALARAHHGSIALDVRQATEQALKEGRLPAVVATASLELGIDMGAVDLVCQVESPGQVARALQRVGRAGHVVGQKSKGRLIPKTPADLLEQAVLAREMAAGRVEEIRVPTNCLDVLAQQVVAAVAVDDWDVTALYGLVRRAYPYRDLSPEAFQAVVEMVSGRYRFGGPGSGEGGATALAALQPRVSWDRVHNRLLALPGTRSLALVGGGTIPDTGQYAAYTTGGARIGELDEEFIYERRVGDTFALGTSVWRLERIDADRVVVSAAEGAPALMPFWRGEQAGRSYDLSLAIGRFLREVGGRRDDPQCVPWLEREYALDPAAARNLVGYVRRQVASAGALPTDRTLVVEAARDPLGDWQVLVLSPWGSRINLGLRWALEAALGRRLGYRPQCLHHNDGVLIRLADADEPVLDVFEGVTPEIVEELILPELADSALFALRFRQNAARALLLPRGQPGKRAPLWLQRLRGRDLLQVARGRRDFPLVTETFRECLRDHLDVPRLRGLLEDVRVGRVEVVARRAEAPSPFASGLLFAFTAAFMYQYDQTDPGPGQAAELDRDLLGQLIAPEGHGHLLDPRAVHRVERRLRGVGQPPRTAAETAEWLRRLGDVTPAEAEGPAAAFFQELEAGGVARQIRLPTPHEPVRWVLAEDGTVYQRAFGLTDTTPEESARAAEAVLGRFLDTHALVGLADVLGRYPFEPPWARRKLEEWAQSGRLVAVPPAGEPEPLQWSAPANWEQVQRGSLALLRREVVPCPPQQFADFVARWHHAHPATRRDGAEGLTEVLDRLKGLPLPTDLWERAVLPARVSGYQPRWLDEAVASGQWAWTCRAGDADGAAGVTFWQRDDLARVAPPPASDARTPGAEPEQVLEALRLRGASFAANLARDTGLLPSAVRAGLWDLVRRGLATNDHFDVIRRGEEPPPAAAEPARRGLVSRRRGATLRSEGRWSLVAWGRPEPEDRVVFRVQLLLGRYGVVGRGLALADPDMPPWRVLYEVLSRMEWVGEVRRGYFVEGLSGAQFALPEAARRLAELGSPSTAAAPAVLLHSLDPANLYGAGAPFDVPLLDGGSRPFPRRAGNWLVQRAGRPVLLVEQNGKRLTTPASATADDVAQAVALLPPTLAAGRRPGVGRKLSVAEWNGEPATASPGRAYLEAAGFVPDYREMTLYAAWR
jgi:ATP-dependent Lhr-like helicase